jgi:uncharacterized protein YjbI with pentapeptide repeats
MNLTPSRDEEIRLIWKENQWLYMVVGFIAGLLFCLLTQLSVLNLPELVKDLLPEAAGILVTITVIDQLNRRRDSRNAIKQLQEQLVRNASSIVNDVANNAMHQLKKRGWLWGDNGLLAGESLSGANLQGADLSGAYLQEADLTHAKLQGALLGWANLQGAYLSAAYLQGANFMEAKLQGADLPGANLQGAFLEGAKLQGANLWSANLRDADLIGANLQGAFLEGAKLQGADLIGANLHGAKLSGPNLFGTGLMFAKFDETTRLPDGTYWTPDTDMTRFTQPENQAGSS